MSKVLWRTEDDPCGKLLCTGYRRFESACGIDGLYKENGDRLDVLAVFANEPGTGQFRDFIKATKDEYKTVCVWHDDNPAVGPALSRYGFTPETEIDGITGEIMKGWRWDRK